MRSLFLGLAALAACLTINAGSVAHAQGTPAAAAAPNPQINLDKGMQMAPAMITAAQISCTATAANYLFTLEADIAGKKTAADFVEVACENNIGYVIATAKDGSGTTSIDCIQSHAPLAEGKANPLKCALPANANPAKTLQASVEALGATCDVQDGRAVGMTAAATFYELSCKDADGIFVGIENPRTSGKLQITTCYQRMETTSPCTLTPKERSTAVVMALASKAPKPCEATKHRYVARANNGSLYYEFACPDGTGFIAEAKPTGEFARAVPCPLATGIAGGCTLSQFTAITEAAITEDKASFTALAKKSGFDCEVSRFGIFPKKADDTTGTKVVELACGNRKEGGIAYVGGTNTVVTCIQGRTQGYKCSYTDEALGNPQLTAALRSKGRTTCAVSTSRVVGFSPEEDFVEVGCSDGAPGWVIAFAARTNTVTDILNCSQADGIAGGCQLASNTKK